MLDSSNFIAYRSSKVSSQPDCIFEIHQLWQSGFFMVYSNCCCSCSFEPEIIKIGQSSHKMYSNNIVHFKKSTSILNACTKKVWKPIEDTTYIYRVGELMSSQSDQERNTLYGIKHIYYSISCLRFLKTFQKKKNPLSVDSSLIYVTQYNLATLSQKGDGHYQLCFYPTPPSQARCRSNAIFFFSSEVLLVWIYNFPSPKLITLPSTCITQTHTYINIYIQYTFIYIYVCVCVCDEL